MKKNKGYKTIPLSFNRRMVAVSASVAKQGNTIHAIIDVDVSKPRRLILGHKEKTGESFSFTAYIVHCLAKAIAENPLLNSFRKRRKLVVLEDVAVGVLVEREIGGEKVPEPMGIREAQKKTCRQIHDEIRAAQQDNKQELGSLSNMGWVKFIPKFLLRQFFKAATKNIWMQKRYGVVSVTAVGMFGKDAVWFVPLGGPTVLVTVGGIAEKPVYVSGKLEPREHLCLTVSFDHDIVDGAPANRFIGRFAEILRNAKALDVEFANKGRNELQ